MPQQWDHIIGPLAGLATSFLWVLTSLFFTAAGRRIGSTWVNATRLALAVVLHATTFWALTGRGWPDAAGSQVLFLALSGVVGLAICDQALFTAFVDIGPRRALLVMTTSPLFALALGVLFLGERLRAPDLIGVALTLGGVAWVTAERSHTSDDDRSHPHERRGLLLALLAAACQAVGFLFSKKGIGVGVLPEAEQLAPQAATYIRMVFGAIGMAPILMAYLARNEAKREAARARRTGRRSTGVLLACCGAVVGPYLGVWMSLVAIGRTPSLGVAQTMCSLSPVLILPFVILLHRERVSARAAVGAAIAVAGAALLTLT